ncbi:hypothetical protein CN563_23795 [Bacillus sp. AFS026049]|nr:hypothetical protein CON84_23865 [Bacillus sp. AFS094228]PEO42858.1 hypothetical protein CN563_23795 [Bacillus sp. AFS026049]
MLRLALQNGSVIQENQCVKHYYLNIDYGVEYKELEIGCSVYSLSLEDNKYILHDDFNGYIKISFIN